MSLCILAGGAIARLAVTAFTLAWSHSVEKTEWREEWRVTPAGLELVQAQVKGSGAGMEPGEGASLVGGWWVWRPDLPPQPELNLAASGATATGWRLCHAGGCLDLGVAEGQGAVIRPCPDKG